MARTRPETDDACVVIKKYANRRLYNTQKSAYVTLEDLAQMVREGVDFVVRDAKSGQDITRAVLTQIIFEEEAKGHQMLPASFLRQLIGLYGDTLQSVVPGYLEASMASFMGNQEAIREQMTRAMGQNPAVANLEAMARHNMEIYESAMRMFNPFGGRPAGRSEAAEPSGGGVKESEFAELKEQLKAMQEKLSKLSEE